MWRETKRRLHEHFADGYAKQRYVEILLYSALGGPSVCALCIRCIPGKDSLAEEEVCARDTNNIKEINTSRYPQFIKLYTVCFSFSFGPRN